MAGFSTGLIRLYNIQSGTKTTEIAAHGRSVTALDVAQDSGLVRKISSILLPGPPPWLSGTILIPINLYMQYDTLCRYLCVCSHTQ